MKSYEDKHGNVIQGVSILESILRSQQKSGKLMQVLQACRLRIDPKAQLTNKKRLWII